jgi:hypothetical protein
MKKFFYSSALVFVLGSISIFSQDFGNKGIIELGGTVGFNSTTFVANGESADDAQTTFWFNPYVGYFFMNGFEVGIIPTFATSSLGDNSTTSFGILLAPAWIFDLRNCWYPFIEGRIGYNTETYSPGVGDDQTWSGLEWGARGGIKAQVGKHALVNVGIFYTQQTWNPKDWEGDRNGYNIFGIEAGVAVFIY